jgi:hypothetical protein
MYALLNLFRPPFAAPPTDPDHDVGDVRVRARARAKPLRLSNAYIYPVFILGSARSGTSTLAHLLKENLGYAGHAEGHVFDLMGQLIATTRSHYDANGLTHRPEPVKGENRCDWRSDATARHLGLSALNHRICNLFVDDVINLYGTRWFDKTPGPNMIRVAPTLAALLPNARFIHLTRDAVSNIESRLRKFPTISFQDHCQDWADAVVAWRNARELLPEGSTLDLMTHELTSDPQATYAKIQSLLANHPAPPTDVPFPRFPLIERTSSQDPSRPRQLAETGWTPDQLQTFHRICGPLLSETSAAPAARPTRAAIVLPPPCGQANVETTFGRGGGIWMQLHLGQEWIFLHPAADPPTTTLTYRDVPIPAHSKLTAQATVNHPAGPNVRFTLTIRTPTGQLAAPPTPFIARPNAITQATIILPKTANRYDITITTESLAPTTEYAWALLHPLTIDPQNP